MRCLLSRFCLALALLVPVSARAAGVDFWVWHRTKPLAAEEGAALKAMGTTTLYWHVGEMENRTDRWRWKAPPRPTQGLAEGWRVVPVVRLTSEVKQPFRAAALAQLREELIRMAGEGRTLQVDYDCPDRLLPAYAAALQDIRRAIPHLSITALTRWPRLDGFSALTAAVEEIAPMFYDLQADPTGVSVEAPPPPLLDPAQIEAALQPWKACPIPWRAGLPTFARLTVFDRTGLSRGQIPNWTWDDLCFHKALHTLAPTRLGVTLFRAGAIERVAATAVAKDELVVSRYADRGALLRATELARAAGAAGIVLFRLPDGSGPGGWSLGNLGELAAVAQPSLVLRRTTDETLELVNEKSIDLGPRLSGEKNDRDRGYALEVDAPAPVFREALAGDFWRVTSHAEPDAKNPVAVVVPLATRLTYWFSHLRGEGSLRTGLFQLAPGASLDSVRYRIVEGGNAGPWKPLSPALPTLALP
jgi:hypothetical protein